MEQISKNWLLIPVGWYKDLWLFDVTRVKFDVVLYERVSLLSFMELTWQTMALAGTAREIWKTIRGLILERNVTEWWNECFSTRMHNITCRRRLKYRDMPSRKMCYNCNRNMMLKAPLWIVFLSLTYYNIDRWSFLIIPIKLYFKI